jgi:glycolate oxidase
MRKEQTLIVDDLSALLPEDRIVADPGVMAGYARDRATWAAFGVPAAVVRPRSADEVQAVVLACLRTGTPIVPRGAGTGLAGGANADDGSVVVSLERMDRIVEINSRERYAVVQPGVVNDDLRAASAREGMWYPPDPASAPWSTIGGNIATNAGGVCCVKYGVTRDYVLELEFVDGRGELLRVGRRTAKGVAGYDLTGLLVGSEGTLGIVTEATLRLRPPRPVELTVAGSFATVSAAGDAVAAVARAGLTPSALELMDSTCLAAVDQWKNMGVFAHGALLLGRTDAPGAAGEAEAEAILDCFRAAGADWAARAADAAESEAFFAARRLAYPAVERLGEVLTEDVCVPTSALPEMLRRVEQASARHHVLIATIAHAGDGNLHPLLVTPPGDTAARAAAGRAFDEILADAIALGGTVTGEHGIGTLKIDGLMAELSDPVLEVHRLVKAALDPHGILNPGKVFSRTPSA